jgi:hypothetical protein
MGIQQHTTAKSVISTFSAAPPPSSSLPKTMAALRVSFCAWACLPSAPNKGACDRGKGGLGGTSAV